MTPPTPTRFARKEKAHPYALRAPLKGRCGRTGGAGSAASWMRWGGWGGEGRVGGCGDSV
ncbi:hypothetical protein GCM10023144_43670 [Pigmentiphaga soli]|uniref:Uncharacterized protein n=1 Tax=Pigmentiphaga soli TaxID=1007095 RepID=A0ABP8HPA7_9BURK